MQTRDEPAAGAKAANVLVLRVKRDILRRSAIGALVTSRSVAQNGIGSNQTVGLDGTFGFFRNPRFRWEYRPGSELFVVYNEERDTQSGLAGASRTRSLILKVNRIFRP